MKYTKRKHRMFIKAACILTVFVFLAGLTLTDSRAVVGVGKAPFEEAERAPGEYAHLDIDSFTIPAHLGEIKYIHKGDPGRVVVHIQDAHTNRYAQRRIADLIDYVNREYGIRTINLEGGVGDYDLAIFTAITGTAIRREVADHFLKKGEINGAEFFAANYPDRAYLWGVEDEDLYMANLKVYRDSLKYSDEVDGYLKELTHILNNLKMKIFNSDLIKVDMNYNAFKAKTLKFRSYLEFLLDRAEKNNVDITEFKNIGLLKRTIEQEKDIDFKKANTERNILVDELKESLSKADVREIITATVDFKTKKISQKAFYAFLLDRAREAGIDTEGFPEMSAYLEYISVFEDIDRFGVVEELDSFQAAVMEPMYDNDTQRSLGKLSKNLAILRNIFAIRLDKPDYNYYLENRGSFDVRNFLDFIEKEAPRHKINARPSDGITRLDDYRDRLSKFFEFSFKRDEVFLDNMKFDRITGGVQGAVLMTGGFHTENLCEIFRREGMSYVSVYPKFTMAKGYKSPYFEILAGDTTGVQQVLRSMIAQASLLQIASRLNELGELAEGENEILAWKLSVAVVTEIIKRAQDLEDKSIIRVGISGRRGTVFIDAVVRTTEIGGAQVRSVVFPDELSDNFDVIVPYSLEDVLKLAMPAINRGELRAQGVGINDVISFEAEIPGETPEGLTTPVDDAIVVGITDNEIEVIIDDMLLGPVLKKIDLADIKRDSIKKADTGRSAPTGDVAKYLDQIRNDLAGNDVQMPAVMFQNVVQSNPLGLNVAMAFDMAAEKDYKEALEFWKAVLEFYQEGGAIFRDQTGRESPEPQEIAYIQAKIQDLEKMLPPEEAPAGEPKGAPSDDSQAAMKRVPGQASPALANGVVLTPDQIRQKIAEQRARPVTSPKIDEAKGQARQILISLRNFLRGKIRELDGKKDADRLFEDELGEEAPTKAEVLDRLDMVGMPELGRLLDALEGFGDIDPEKIDIIFVDLGDVDPVMSYPEDDRVIVVINTSRVSQELLERDPDAFAELLRHEVLEANEVGGLTHAMISHLEMMENDYNPVTKLNQVYVEQIMKLDELAAIEEEHVSDPRGDFYRAALLQVLIERIKDLADGGSPNFPPTAVLLGLTENQILQPGKHQRFARDVERTLEKKFGVKMRVFFYQSDSEADLNRVLGGIESRWKLFRDTKGSRKVVFANTALLDTQEKADAIAAQDKVAGVVRLDMKPGHEIEGVEIGIYATLGEAMAQWKDSRDPDLMERIGQTLGVLAGEEFRRQLAGLTDDMLLKILGGILQVPVEKLDISKSFREAIQAWKAIRTAL